MSDQPDHDATEPTAVEPTEETADTPVVKKVRKTPAKRAPRKAKAPAPKRQEPAALSWEQDPAVVPEPVEPVTDSVTEPVEVDTSPQDPGYFEPDPDPVPVVVTPGRTEVTSAAGTVTLEGMRSRDNWRAFIHQLTPVVVATFVTLGVVTEDMALLWVPLVFAVIDPLMSYANAADKGRRIAYGVLGALQSGGLLVALLGDKSPWLPIISALLVAVSSQLARFYTPTTTVVPPESPRAVTHAASR